MCAIYLKVGEELVEMVEQPYEAEDVLQRLLADYPGLLAGDLDEEPRRRWLLVQREIGIAGEEDGSDRWSLDHLFLDRDGVPTLVEVKRSSDTRLRREVVGQLLDYAANASAFWGLEKIRLRLKPGMVTRPKRPPASRHTWGTKRIRSGFGARSGSISRLAGSA